MKRLLRTLTPLLLLSLFLLPAAAADAAPWADVCSPEEWECLRQVNKYRASEGYDAISLFSTLQTYSDTRADEVSRGAQESTRLSDLGLYARYHGQACAQAADPAAAIPALNDYGAFSYLLGDYHHGAVGHAEDTWYFTGLEYVCTVSDMRLWTPTGETRIEVGQSIDDLNAVLVYTCDVHGECYLPVTAELCKDLNKKAPDTSAAGAILVQLNVHSTAHYFTLLVGDAAQEDLPPVNGTIYEYPFTYRITDGRATITAFDHPRYELLWVRVPETIAGCPVVALGDRLFDSLLWPVGDIYLPDTIESIGEATFSFTRFTSINIPKNLKSLGQFAFYGSTLTGPVRLPNSLTQIGAAAFHQLADLLLYRVDEEGNVWINHNYTGDLYLAGYDDAGRMTAVHSVTTSSNWYDLPSSTAEVRLFRLDDTLAPISEPIPLSLTD